LTPTPAANRPAWSSTVFRIWEQAAWPSAGRASPATYDDWRKAIILEPRGNDVLVGALLCKPVSPQATAGVIFFNNAAF
jgi:proline racemase